MVLTDITAIASGIKKPSVATLGSHSALDICEGAKQAGLPTIVACQKGRETTYSKYYKSRKIGGRGGENGSRTIGCIDEILLLDRFAQIADKKNIDYLNGRQSLFVPHRSFSVYVGYDRIENDFSVPIFGNRWLLKAEERTASKNQGYLLRKAGVRTPKVFSSPEDIDRLVIVKASEAKRSYERAFFFAKHVKDYERMSKEYLDAGVVTKDGLASALIEEVVLGAHINFNFFYSPLSQELELMGTDTRRQTNLDGILRLPADQQSKVLGLMRVNNIEVGHIACTVRESLLELGFEAGEKFLEACRKDYAPGIIGPFALQGAITSAQGGEEFVVFDVSFRMPGSPGIRFTPYTGYIYGKQLSMGQRVAMEIKEAAKQGEMEKIVT